MIIGHEIIQKFFERVIQNNRVNHAYIFVGPEHIGKRKLADWFISKLIGVAEEKLGVYPDLTIVQRERDADGDIARGITVEAVRKLRSALQLSSFLNSWKIAIIEDADALTLQAANALLKILEEPHAKTCFILLAKHLESLPATVVSRSQVVRFQRVRDELIEKALSLRGAESIQARIIARFAHGLPGRALTFLNNQDQCEQYKDDLENIERFSIIGLAERFTKSAKLLEDKEIDAVLDTFLFVLHNQTLLHYNCKELALAELLHAPRKDPAQSMEQILQYKEWLEFNVNKNLILENILLNL